MKYSIKFFHCAVFFLYYLSFIMSIITIFILYYFKIYEVVIKSRGIKPGSLANEDAIKYVEPTLKTCEETDSIWIKKM